MEQFADDLAALLDGLAIREPVVLCGLSMGGYVALQFWKKYADRLRGLILCNTRANADSPETAANRLAVADRLTHEGTGDLGRKHVASIILGIYTPTQCTDNRDRSRCHFSRQRARNGRRFAWNGRSGPT